MKKNYPLLIVIVVVAFTACGGRNSKSDKAHTSSDGAAQIEQSTSGVVATSEPEDKSLEGTKWRLNDSFDDLTSVEYLLVFDKGGRCEYTIQYFNSAGGKENAGSGHYVGTYDFDGNAGELNLKSVDGGDSYDNGHIRLQDDKHMLVRYGAARTLIKQ